MVDWLFPKDSVCPPEDDDEDDDLAGLLLGLLRKCSRSSSAALEATGAGNAKALESLLESAFE